MGSRKKNKHRNKKQNHNRSSSAIDPSENGHDDKVRRVVKDKEKEGDDFANITIFNSPLVSLRALSIILFNTLKSVLGFIMAHWVVFLIATVSLVTAVTVPLP